MITKDLLQALRGELEEAMTIIADKYNVQLKMGNSRYTDDNFTVKIEGSAITADGSVKSKEAAAFKQQAALYGLKPEDLGLVFNAGEKEFTIIGLSTKAKKFPILARCTQDGKTYKLDAAQVVTLLGLIRKMA